MDNDLDLPAVPAGADPSADRAGTGQPRRQRVAALLTAALPATTAMLAVTQPKLPPCVGD
jgi:hypothetical protein